MFMHLQYIPGALKNAMLQQLAVFFKKNRTNWQTPQRPNGQIADADICNLPKLHLNGTACIFNWTALQDIYLPVELIGSPESLGNYMIYLD